VNLLKNKIGVDQAKELVSILKAHPTLKSLCGNKGDETKLDMSGKISGAGDAIMLAAETVDNGALSVLNLAENNLGGLVLPEGWTEEYDSDNYEYVYRHTDGREQKDKPGKPEGILAIANAIPDMGALSKLLMRKNCLCNRESGKVLSKMLAANTVLKELDVSDNRGSGAYDGPGFAQELSAGIRDNRALTKLDISSNYIGTEQEGGLQRICLAGGIELGK
jgi:hypothetical protein